MREFSVTIRVVREHTATIKVVAASQEDADREAIAMYWRDLGASEMGDGGLRLPKRWVEHEPRESDPTIDRAFRCVDCGQDAGYYMVSDALWAATGLGPHDGMLCLLCLEKRVGRRIEFRDFTAVLPRAGDWDRYVKGAAA
jgi:hypothetical protein